MKYNRKTVLLAPTGRAAKVISAYTNRKAYTIHKHIYYPKVKAGSIQFELQKNKASHTIYIVDEASMIPIHALNAIDKLLRELTGENIPFGG